MPDHSFLDDKYFIDSHVYNCPFCNRRNVQYDIEEKHQFNWTEDRECYVFVAICTSCRKSSMHLSYNNIEIAHKYTTSHGTRFYRFSDEYEDLDSLFFYSVPTSFFSLDGRIPNILRELLTEAEGSLNGNFLTGASACVRKIVYELGRLNGLTEGNYDKRIKFLKDKHQEVDGTYFDTLLTIQRTTSSKVHENAYDGWEAKHVRLLLSALREILHELYVVPALRNDRRKGILDLQKEVLGDSPASTEDGAGTDGA